MKSESWSCLELVLSAIIEFWNAHHHHHSLTKIKGLQTSCNGGFEFGGLSHSFGMGAKGRAHHFKLPMLTVKSGVKIFCLGRIAIGVHPQGGFFHRLPAAVVQNHGEDGKTLGL